jgi:hypothetical protein
MQRGGRFIKDAVPTDGGPLATELEFAETMHQNPHAFAGVRFSDDFSHGGSENPELHL